MQKISDFATETLESAGDLLGEFILGEGIPLLAPAPLGGGEQQWIENKNKRDIEQWQQQEKEKQEKEKTQD